MNVEKISNAYADMLARKDYNTTDLEKALNEVFQYKINVRVIQTPEKNMFIMAITPDVSTIDKIANNILNEEGKFDLIVDAWKKSPSWTIDIDSNVFNFLSANELTALTLHEIGHMIEGNSVPTRITTVLQVGLGNSFNIANRAIAKNRIFNKILTIPIISACYFNPDKIALKREMKADTLASKNGYANDLISAMNKIISKISSSSIRTSVDDVNASIIYTKEILDNLEKRKLNLVKKDLKNFMDHSPASSSIYEAVEDIDQTFGYDRTFYFEDLASKIANDEYIVEFGFGGNLKPITRDQIDYIRVKVDGIKTSTDKMMMLSYINSKLELAEYYLSVLGDKKLRKKYKVPHDENYLRKVVAVLNEQKTIAFNKPLEDLTPRIVVSYPAGYEG